MLDALISKFSNAEGRSEFVIIVVCDIRKFSEFSKDREAPEIAIFVSKFYEKLLREYFSEAVFAKPTGDGLIMVFKHKSNQADLVKVSDSVVNACIKALSDYPTILTDDLMINFRLPEKIGFGIARGIAFCLYSGDEIIDYSGQILNLASRLNDLAKPGGIVIDGAYLYETIPPNCQSIFQSEDVYIRGIFEDSPQKIFYSDSVVIPESAKLPLTSYKWQKTTVDFKYSNLKKITGTYTVFLPSEPLDKDRCKIQINWPNMKNTDLIRSMNVSEFTLNHDADGYGVTFDLEQEVLSLSDERLEADSKVKIIVQFVPKYV